MLFRSIEVLKAFCNEYEPNYNEFMELRNAIEELGGDFDMKEDFDDDPLYRYLKGLDEVDDRKSPFFDDGAEEEEDDADDCHCWEHDGCGCHCDDGCEDDCECGGHHEHCGCHPHEK